MRKLIPLVFIFTLLWGCNQNNIETYSVDVGSSLKLLKNTPNATVEKPDLVEMLLQGETYTHWWIITGKQVGETKITFKWNDGKEKTILVKVNPSN